MNRFLSVLFLFAFFAISDCYSNTTSSVATSQRRMHIKYTVKKGESISLILKKFQIPLDVFFKDNPDIEAKGTVNIGDKVFINRSARGTANDAMINRQIKDFVLKRLEDENPEWYNEGSDIENGDKTFDIHVVKQGESIRSISEMYNVAYDDVIRENMDILKQGIKVNLKLRIPLKYHIPVDSTANFEVDYKFRDDDEDTNVIKVAILMPIDGEDVPKNDGFIDLYRGFLMAADKLKAMGLSTEIDFYGVGRDTLIVNELVNNGALFYSELIIGPVFSEQFEVVASFASKNGIPIINPLMRSEFSAGNVIEITPQEDRYWEKLKGIAKDKYVLHYISPKEDSTFLIGLDSIGVKVMDTMKYDKFIKPEDMLPKFSSTMETLVVIAPEEEFGVELLLSKLAAIKALDGRPKFSVLAPSIASGIAKDKKGDFYKVKTTYIGQSFQDRINAESFDFESEYISIYSLIPTAYSYRGYEIGMLFLKAYKDYGLQFVNKINGIEETVLQIPYLFSKKLSNDKLTNQNWIKITYNPNYKITVE